jgi:hypothetical protein
VRDLSSTCLKARKRYSNTCERKEGRKNDRKKRVRQNDRIRRRKKNKLKLYMLRVHILYYNIGVVSFYKV